MTDRTEAVAYVKAELAREEHGAFADCRTIPNHYLRALIAQPDERMVERLGESLFVLSDRLKRVGALDSDNVHAAYEQVVVAYQAIAALHGEG